MIRLRFRRLYIVYYISSDYEGMSRDKNDAKRRCSVLKSNTKCVVSNEKQRTETPRQPNEFSFRYRESRLNFSRDAKRRLTCWFFGWFVGYANKREDLRIAIDSLGKREQ